MADIGLVSVSFRSLCPEEIIKHCVRCKIRGIEWGSDVHVPAGDTVLAAEIGKMTRESGLEVYSYGSYYRAGENPNPEKDFLPYLESAVALGAPVIRIWAGTKPSASASDEYRRLVESDAKTVCRMCREHGIKAAFEYHEKTLTDNCRSAVSLVENIDEENARLYWQPENRQSFEHNLEGLKAVLPYAENIHVFYWTFENGVVRRSLSEADGNRMWKKYAETIRVFGGVHRFLLEFIKDDSTELLEYEAAALKQILEDKG